MKQKIKIPALRLLVICLMSVSIFACGNRESSVLIFDNSKKVATESTKAVLQSFRDELNFDNKEDSLAATFGFKGTLFDSLIVEGNDTIFDLSVYDFIDPTAFGGNYPETVNPSLWRQSYLNRLNGLFELDSANIYQIRGFDLANMTFVRDGFNNWIVIDPLGSPGTAAAGLKLFEKFVQDNLEQLRVTISAIFFTHSHIDHFGGVSGIMDHAKTEDIPVYAPEGFFEEAVSENVMAGNCMGRRASYMYGNLLDKNTMGTVGTGLGTTTSSGLAGIRKETVIISGPEPVMKYDLGMQIEFLYAPSSEAPAEMMFYFHKYDAFCQAEDLNRTLHNLYTLRGAKVRNGQKWAKYIDEVIRLWSSNVKLSFGSHHWPTHGNDKILTFWEKQRDMYRFLHDQTLRLANQGLTPRELADSIKLPKELSKEFYSRGYYGSVSHDIKAQYQLYFGWFDGNPANLNPLPPSESGAAYLDYIGREALFEAGVKAYSKGEYRWAAEVLNHIAFGDTSDLDARYLLADTYEQLGYQAESGPWRNFYLSGAKELRDGVIEYSTPNTAGPDMIAGMSNELLMDYLAMKFRGTENGAAQLDFQFNIEMDMEIGGAAPEKITLIVSNGAVSPRIGSHIPDLGSTRTVSVKRSDINLMIIEGKSLEQLIEDEKFTFGSEDCRSDFTEFASFIDTFEFWFPIVRPL